MNAAQHTSREIGATIPLDATVFPDVRSFPDFESAAAAVLEYLHQQLGFGLWMVTRTEDEDWIVLQARNEGAYAIGNGDILRWSDSFCSRMVRGEAPQVAPRAMDVPSYASAPVAQDLDIAAYLGAPLAHADGSLFGTLCAIDPSPQPAGIAKGQPLVELCAQLLSTLLDRERQVAREARLRERAEEEADGDVLTGLLSRRGWERILAREEARCKRNGSPACVIVGDLDELKQVNDERGHAAGDELLLFAAGLLVAACRRSDAPARLGGDEFAILAPETSPADGALLVERLRAVLDAADIEMSLGVARREPDGDLAAAWEAADQAMLVDKARRRGRP